MMRRLSLLLCILLALPCAAQTRRATAHLDIGAGPSGGGGYTNTGGLFGRVGGRVPLGPDVDLGLDAALFGSLIAEGCKAGSVEPCPPNFPVVKSLLGSLTFPVTGRYDYHQVTASVGVGEFWFSGTQIRAFSRFGVEFGTEMILVRRMHSTYTLGARADLVTQTPRGHTWLLPITAGVRF